jgi:hypothetical protein
MVDTYMLRVRLEAQGLCICIVDSLGVKANTIDQLICCLFGRSKLC